MKDDGIFEGFLDALIMDRPYLDRFCKEIGVRLAEVRWTGEIDSVPAYYFIGELTDVSVTMDAIRKFIDKLPS